jgi:putative membrane protein
MWHFEWIIFLLIAGVIYYYVCGPLTKKLGFTEDRPSIWQQYAFYGGLLTVFIAYGTPIEDLGHDYLFSAHMLSMGLIYLVMPPLLIIGVPVWVYRRVLELPVIRSIFKFLTHPLIAILLFNIFFSMYHVPGIFNFMSNHMVLHLCYHYLLILFSVFMWWPIVCPVSEIDYLSELQKMGYIFANGVLLTPACALIIFGDTPMYTIYEHAPRIFDVFPVIVDQQFGGIEMKIMQEIVYGCALGYVFVKWMKKQKNQDQQEALREIKGYAYLEIKQDSNPL